MTLGYFIDAKKARGRKVLAGVKFSKYITAVYYQALRAVVERIQKDFAATVIEGLDTREMAAGIVRDESPMERYKRKLREFNKRLRGKYSSKFIEQLVRKCLARAEQYSKRQMEKELKSFGIDIKQDLKYKKYSGYMAAAVAENTQLVQGLIDEQAKRLNSTVLRGIREGVPVGRLAGDIQRNLRVGKKRALLIARTETHKVTQQVADMRARDLGCRFGIWRAVMDERTSEQHARFNGRKFDLAGGLYDSRTDTVNWPGRRPNCRCHTEYLIEGLDV